MNRGSQGQRCAGSRRRPRFNEAPIHESGKSTQARPVNRAASGFNEAPIHESGKLHGEDPSAGTERASMRPRFMNRGSAVSIRARAWRVVASMRPRFMNRGSVVTPWTARRKLVSFNEAPIHESGKFA